MSGEGPPITTDSHLSPWGSVKRDALLQGVAEGGAEEGTSAIVKGNCKRLQNQKLRDILQEHKEASL